MSSSAPSFELSNALGDGMVLQRAPQRALTWGFGTPGSSVAVTLGAQRLPPVLIGADGVWRVSLPPQPASLSPTTIFFDEIPRGDGGGGGGSSSRSSSRSSSPSPSARLSLRDVLFGDVLLCSGQSNMQFSVTGLANQSRELEAADAYAERIRLFMVGMDTSCSHPAAAASPSCALPQRSLNMHMPSASPGGRGNTCTQWRAGKIGAPCRLAWSRASRVALAGPVPPRYAPREFAGVQLAGFSAVCWLVGRRLSDALGGAVPIGLIAASWGATPLAVWQPYASHRDCNPRAKGGGVLYNTMIAPLAFGPMSLRAMLFYHGENSVGSSSYYACAFPSLIQRWRSAFGRGDDLWFGFVQIGAAGVYTRHSPGRGGLVSGRGTKVIDLVSDVEVSHEVGDLRQAQLSALRLPNVRMAVTIDCSSEWVNNHPLEKGCVARRLADAALRDVYGAPRRKLSRLGGELPLFARSRVVSATRGTPIGAMPSGEIGGEITGEIAVRVDIRWGGRLRVALTRNAPIEATRGTGVGWGGRFPRNRCVATATAPFFEREGVAKPVDCGYAAIIGRTAGGAALELNATAEISSSDGSALILRASGAPSGFRVTATSYGRGVWPVTSFFARPLHGNGGDGGDGGGKGGDGGGKSGGGEGGEGSSEDPTGERSALLPVIPWHSAIDATDPYAPPPPETPRPDVLERQSRLEAYFRDAMRSCRWVTTDWFAQGADASRDWCPDLRPNARPRAAGAGGVVPSAKGTESRSAAAASLRFRRDGTTVAARFPPHPSTVVPSSRELTEVRGMRGAELDMSELCYQAANGTFLPYSPLPHDERTDARPDVGVRGACVGHKWRPLVGWYELEALKIRGTARAIGLGGRLGPRALSQLLLRVHQMPDFHMLAATSATASVRRYPGMMTAAAADDDDNHHDKSGAGALLANLAAFLAQHNVSRLTPSGSPTATAMPTAISAAAPSPLPRRQPSEPTPSPSDGPVDGAADAAAAHWRDHRAWPPLESFDGLGADLSHPEPMAAVVRGEASCVIVRSVMRPNECDAALARLVERGLMTRDGRAGRAAYDFPFRRGAAAVETGITMQELRDPTAWEKHAERVNALFDGLFDGLSADPLRRLAKVLDQLAKGSGKRVRPPRNMSGAARGTPGVFRSSLPGAGSVFRPHVDGFSQGVYEHSWPRKMKRPFAAMSRRYGTHAVMSAILVLQEPDTQLGGQHGSGTLYNASVDDLTTPNGRAARTGAEGKSYGFGVKFPPERIFPFLDSHRVARHNPVVRTGDLYLFSASRVHEVFNVFGSKARVVANSFLAWDDKADEVCMYQ